MRPELQQPEPSGAALNVRLLIAIALGSLPLALGLTLNFQRPDLMKPMMEHVFGYTLSAVTLLCVLGGFVVYIVAAQQKTAGSRIGISVAGFFVCTLPALFLMLFGPIVFAFMYGDIY